MVKQARHGVNVVAPEEAGAAETYRSKGGGQEIVFIRGAGGNGANSQGKSGAVDGSGGSAKVQRRSHQEGGGGGGDAAVHSR